MGAQLSQIDKQPEVQNPQRNDNETGTAKPSTEERLPHNHEEILKNADKPIDKSTTEKLNDQLRKGVFLNRKKQKYWVDKNMNNCFMLYAKDLSITWGEDRRYWHWPTTNDTDGDEPPVAAELIKVCWLEIHGRFNTANLTPGTTYEFFFDVQLKDRASGWGNLVNLRLILPDGNKKESTENLSNRPKGIRLEIPVGEFTASPEKNGEMKISLYQYDSVWKSGLVLNGIIIRPKN